MPPLVEITDVYQNPLRNSSINTNYEQDPSIKQQINNTNQCLDDIIYQKRKELGIENIRPIDLPEGKAEELKRAIKSESSWHNYLKELVSVLAPEIGQEDISEAIYLPWWNAELVVCKDDSYNPELPSLSMNIKLSHSYLSQLINYRKLVRSNDDAISISNVLISRDNFIVLGVRAGNKYAGTIMNIPAGSVEYHTGKNPLFESFYAEYEEEIGLKPEHIEKAELIGKISKFRLENQSHYIFRTKANLSFEELIKIWNASYDKREHTSLKKYKNNPDTMIKAIIHRRYDPIKEDSDNPTKTTPANKGKILPQCSASLILHFAQEKGISWAYNALKELKGEYVLGKNVR